MKDFYVLRCGELAFGVRFPDGLSGKVRFLPSYLYGVFEKLKYPDFFNQLKVTDGFVPWSDEIDLAPRSMYRAISQAGEWLLSWNEFSRAARAVLPCETHPDSAGHSAMIQPSSADITNILSLAYSAKQSF